MCLGVPCGPCICIYTFGGSVGGFIEISYRMEKPKSLRYSIQYDIIRFDLLDSGDTHDLLFFFLFFRQKVTLWLSLLHENKKSQRSSLFVLMTHCLTKFRFPTLKKHSGKTLISVKSKLCYSLGFPKSTIHCSSNFAGVFPSTQPCTARRAKQVTWASSPC